jgi:hypothetical protein
MSAARKKTKVTTLGQIMKAHAQASERRDRLVNEASVIVKIPKALDKAVGRAHDAVSASFSDLCRYRPRDADELLQWLPAVLADEQVTGESIRVVDGLAALSSAHNSLSRLLVPASEMHSR